MITTKDAVVRARIDPRLRKRAAQVLEAMGTGRSACVKIGTNSDHNLAGLPEKRNEKGVAQAQRAISIAGGYLRDTLAHRSERELFNQIELVRLIVTNDRVAAICRQLALDVLSCVPLDWDVFRG